VARQLTDQARIDFFAGEVARLRRQLTYARGRYSPRSTPAELAKYTKYRNSAKGHARTQRYNSSPARQEADARYRATTDYMLNYLRRRIARNTLLLQTLEGSLTT
jgi:hypothetical protein